MVKGSWDKKSDAASARRLEQKVKKKQGKQLSGQTVMAQLASGNFNIPSSRILVWCAATESRNICCDWFRTDSCMGKKCKFGHHGATIAHVLNVYRGDIPTYPFEVMCEPPVLLQDLPAREAHRIHFIAIGNRCVFDYLFPSVWETFLFEYVVETTAAAAVHAAPVPAASSSETGTIMDNSSRYIAEIAFKDKVKSANASSSDNNSNIGQAETALLALNIAPVLVRKSATGDICQERAFQFADIWEHVPEHLLSFLDDAEIMHLSKCSKSMRKMLLSMDSFRQRKREFFSRVAGDFSKHKKAEQKKKKKQANNRKPGAYTSTVKRCY